MILAYMFTLKTYKILFFGLNCDCLELPVFTEQESDEDGGTCL